MEKITEIFPKGTMIDEIMDFPHDNIKWDKWEEHTAENVKMTIEKLKEVV